jgi:hypothetical protein
MTESSSYSLLIQKLDAFIRKYYLNQLIRGSLYSVGIIGGLFLLFSLLEHEFYFSTSVRQVLFYSFILVSVTSLGKWVVSPMMRYFHLGKTISHERAATIIGNHFQDVQDRLLNILQLKHHSDSYASVQLIEASIEQKSQAIRLVPFKSAINLGKNKKYLKYALPPLLLIIGFLFVAPSVLTESSSRIIKNTQEFAPDAPFAFEIENPELKVRQFEDYTLIVSTEGDVVPNEAFISIEGSQYRLKKTGNGTFSYKFNTVQSDLTFHLSSGPVKSDELSLEVLLRPQIATFDTELDYPAYTGYRDEILKNSGDLVIPEGSKITWLFSTLHADSLHLSIDNVLSPVKRRGQNEFVHSQRMKNSTPYKLFISNSNSRFEDSVSYNISVIPDQYPSISVEVFEDSLDQRFLFFAGDVSDDYGLRNLSFNYNIKRHEQEKGATESLAVGFNKGRNSTYDLQWDLGGLDLKPGDELTYFFEVFDNDAVNGSKSARTAVLTYQMATEEELKENLEANSKEIKKKLKSTIDRSRDIQSELEKLREKLLQNKEPRWEDRQKLEDLIKQQQELQKEFERAKQQFEENLKNQEQLSPQDKEMLQKEEKLKEMFEEVVDEEMEKLMEEIQKLMEELDKDFSMDKMDDLKLSQEEMEEEMDRLLELYKQLEVEKDIQDAVKKLEELAEKEQALSEETEKGEKEQEALKKEQEEINKEFDELKEKMEDIEKKNEELEKPNDLGDPEEEMEDIEKDLNDSEQQLDQKQNKGASKSQKSAAGKMKKMASGMQDKMQQSQQQQQEEDIKTMRQLLENLVTLSFDQEDLVTYVSRTNPSTPRYVELVQEEYKLKDDFGLVKDSLFALAKRNFQIEPYITEKVGDITAFFDGTLVDLEERNKGKAGEGQRRIMTNVNDLALMLAESLQKMQQQLANQMKGNQMCNKPGGNGPSGTVPMDKITKGQKGLSKELQDLKDGLKEGKGEGMSKEFAKAAARQAALRRALEGLQKKKQEQGKGSQALDEIIDQMDKMEIDLINKRLDNEALRRQKDIETRLLEAEKAERQRELDDKRESQTAEEMERKLPPSLEEYLQKREAELEQYQRVSPELRPYYKQLVEDYYKSLKKTSE